MTRNLLFACAVMAAAALATVWSLAPGCEGSYCLGSSYRTGVDLDSAGASEAPSAGRELVGGNARKSAPAAAPQAWLSTQDPQADTQASWSEPDPSEAPDEAALAQEPEIASEDWQGRQTAPTERNEAQFEEADDDEEPKLTPKQRKAQAAAAAKAAKDWESLADAAINEPDDQLRGSAIQSVGVYRHSDAVAVLNEVAALDPSPDNRLQALEQLWYSAADGLDRDGMIRNTLQTALNDPDEAIAKMAERALADLQALEQAHEEAQEFN